MKFYFNILFLICLSFFMISCSSINNLDVSKIIDKTERWLFDDVDDNSDEKEASIDEFSGKKLTEENVEVEEVFPDINDVPQLGNGAQHSWAAQVPIALLEGAVPRLSSWLSS